jgi:Predicted membrane protein (DUF2306)
VACLLAAPAAVVLSTGSTGGPMVAAGLGTLGTLWFLASAQGWRFARQRRFADHRAWMIRSFALTFAVVPLRLELHFADMMGWPALESYRVAAFLCWIPNLVLAELYLRLGSRVPYDRLGLSGL